MIQGPFYRSRLVSLNYDFARFMGTFQGGERKGSRQLVENSVPIR